MSISYIEWSKNQSILVSFSFFLSLAFYLVDAYKQLEILDSLRGPGQAWRAINSKDISMVCFNARHINREKSKTRIRTANPDPPLNQTRIFLY